MTLARTVLHCTVREAMERIDAREFAEWKAEYRLNPWDAERGDLNSGIIAAAVANSRRVKGDPFKATDFMPDFEKQFADSDEEVKRKQVPAKVRSLMSGLRGLFAARGKAQ